MTALLTACTHNDGDINGWYGTWHIDTMEYASGHDSSLPTDADIYLQFQSSVVCMRYTDPLHNDGESYGSWSEDGGVMHIEFNGTFDVQDILPQSCSLTVVSHNGKHAVLSIADYCTYHLTRQP